MRTWRGSARQWAQERAASVVGPLSVDRPSDPPNSWANTRDGRRPTPPRPLPAQLLPGPNSYAGPTHAVALVKVHGCNSNRFTPNERFVPPEKAPEEKSFVGDLSRATPAEPAYSFVNLPVSCNLA